MGRFGFFAILRGRFFNSPLKRRVPRCGIHSRGRIFGGFPRLETNELCGDEIDARLQSSLLFSLLEPRGTYMPRKP